ncbi:PEP-CTERM sorting domain-containing protein [Fortiea sp. LEGE XX443]|uniref:PEP-CTERM sorting domain-containing protein n=1 Tax=Fortiea sp. LEGE XX443 TaxID=1828611 RepID=UPI0018800A5B|nr:PEP-CTERM sorting domain-containing protein [Fortiea sp. LEGE XX443]MBE9008478.1 PEP-CTERM sorting domain-containing protein [Fortiea sp. LEGE XX443]
MNKFKSLCLGATLAATTMAGVALAPSSAMAITLTGEVVFSAGALLGDPTLGNNLVESVDWTTNQGSVLSTSGDFATATPALSLVTLRDLVLTREIAGNPAVYGVDTDTAFTSFADFGNVTIDGDTNRLTFAITGGKVTRTINDGQVSLNIQNDTSIVSGIFRFGGQTIANGLFSLNGTSSSGGGLVTLTATGEPVPEPLTMGGIALGATFGAYLRKRYSKNGEKLVKA